MIQCFANPKTVSDFRQKSVPRLFSASKIDSSYSIYPRVLHSHENMVEVLLVRSGSGIYIIDSRRYIIRQGDMIICNSGVLHDEDPAMSSNLNTYCCTLTGISIDGLENNCLIMPDVRPVIQTGECFFILEELMGMIYALLSSELPDKEKICSYFTEAFLSLVDDIICRNKITESSKKPTSSKMLALDVKNYIDLHYDEEITLKSLGQKLHVNPYYLAHAFKDELGYSPIQYITRRRIGEAQSMLITTKFSVTYIANLVGYGNPNHFILLFTKYVGMSPNKYRKSYIKI